MHAFELHGCSDAVHHLAGACEDVIGHCTLGFYLFVADGSNRMFGTAADGIFQHGCFLTVERKSQQIFYDVFVHIVESLFSVEELVGSLGNRGPVCIPSPGHSGSQIGSQATDTMG